MVISNYPMKAIFHAPPSSFNNLKSNWFTHVEISLTSNCPTFMAMQEGIKAAHLVGLGSIIAPFSHEFENHYGLREAINFLKIQIALGNIDFYKDIVALPDEINLKVRCYFVEMFSNAIKECDPRFKTLSILSWLDSYLGYENKTDYVCLNYYKRFTDLWSLGKLILRVRNFQNTHKGKLVAIPAIRYSTWHIRIQKIFWNWIGVDGFYWYSFSGSAGEYGFNNLLEERLEWINEL